MSDFKGKKDIIHSLLPVLSDPRFVLIRQERLADFCARLRARHFSLHRWNYSFIYTSRDEIGIDYFMLMNALNFCYWGSPKWTVEYNGKSYDGAFGMFAALKRAIEEGVPIWEGDYLASINKSDLSSILRGNVKIPLLEERFHICREVGRVLSKHFSGRFHRLVRQADGSAVRLVSLLVSYLPSFNDSVEWGDGMVLFYKRAQLAPAIISEHWGGKGDGEFSDLDLLTASADYKIPQVLRKLGILEYVNGLEKMVDEGRFIPNRSREEIEIRASTIMATEMILARLQKVIKGINAQHIDRLLWLIGQKPGPNDKPYHKTLTIHY